MAVDATGSLTSPDNIPTYNTAADAPSGKGLNNIIAAVQAALTKRPSSDIASLVANDVPVWTGSAWVRPSGTGSAATFLAGDGSWKAVSGGDWQSVAATLTYSTTDGPTFVVTTGGVDLTGSIPLGARIRVTHAAATKYFIVTAINATTITLYGGTTYTLAATAITVPFFSQAKVPLGFPVGPDLWTEQLSDTSQRFQVGPTSGTWYNLGALQLSVPIGYWRLQYNVLLRSLQTSTAAGTVDFGGHATLSSTSSTETDITLTSGLNYWEYSAAPGAAAGFGSNIGREGVVSLATKRTYFLNARWTNNANATANEIDFQGAQSPTTIRAICAYL